MLQLRRASRLCTKWCNLKSAATKLLKGGVGVVWGASNWNVKRLFWNLTEWWFVFNKRRQSSSLILISTLRKEGIHVTVGVWRGYITAFISHPRISCLTKCLIVIRDQCCAGHWEEAACTNQSRNYRAVCTWEQGKWSSALRGSDSFSSAYRDRTF